MRCVFGGADLLVEISRITFSTWDFGGQSVFHNLHHLFLSRYSVYLVVFKMPHMLKDPQRAAEMIRYWLNSLALHAKGAPILLVGTHKDQVWVRGNLWHVELTWLMARELILLMLRGSIRELGSVILTATDLDFDLILFHLDTDILDGTVWVSQMSFFKKIGW